MPADLRFSRSLKSEVKHRRVPLGASVADPPDDIALSFGPDVNDRVRARMTYAFRVFAAIYNYKVVDFDSDSAAFRCLYGGTSEVESDSRILVIPARYQSPAGRAKETNPTKCSYSGESLYLTHGLDAATGTPDWLGEIFEWLSSSHEFAATRRDALGRIPFSETIFARQGFTPRKPYANILMAWMESALQGRRNKGGIWKPPSPIPGTEHLVLSSHDIDFHHTSKASALGRILKNFGIGAFIYRSPTFFADNARNLLELLRGNPVGHYLPRLIDTIEKCGFRSTFFVVCRRGHRRDPRYELEQIVPHLEKAAENGFSVGVHGSYRSVAEDASLALEARRLEKLLGKPPIGSRQHWLRFSQHDKLFREIERAGVAFDSTLGFAETVGFRNGASFAFPPYNFEKEAPYPFLEFPLALMDGNIEAACRLTGENPQDVVNEVLSASRKWGWGGIAVLWHNPIEPLSVPSNINRVFWKCAREQSVHREQWVSAEHFLQVSLSRYQNAGLLLNVPAQT